MDAERAERAVRERAKIDGVPRPVFCRACDGSFLCRQPMSASLAHRVFGKLRRTGLALRLKSLEGRLDVDPRRTLLLFAALRGGSTWLEQIARAVPGTATIWEPLDRERVPEVRRLGFNWRQYIPEDASWPEAEELFKRLFSGRMLNPHLAYSSTPDELRKATRLVVKLGRGHLLLPWLIRHFQVPKPVFLVRHPCAVVNSQLKKGAWHTSVIKFDVPPHRYDEHLKNYEPLLDGINTLEERQAALWCMEHKFLLDHPRNDVDWTTISYEELITRPEPTLEKVFTGWGIPMPGAALDMLRVPSSTTLPGSPLHDVKAQIDQWRHALEPDQVDRILAIVRRFGIDLYDRDPMPHRSFTP